MTRRHSLPEPDTYVSINEVCARYMISRRTFYRLLADPGSGLAEIVVRIPPKTGHYRVPLHGFAQWLEERQ